MADETGNLGGAGQISQSPVTSDDTSHGGGGGVLSRRPPPSKRGKKQSHDEPPVNLQLSEDARALLERMEKEAEEGQDEEEQGDSADLISNGEPEQERAADNRAADKQEDI